ncbi:MAG: PAS domain S-box protein [Deltaproteobacteria bacterium]|nr:PAS domain S-box protein [Deltaproteobacteria bacterium]
MSKQNEENGPEPDDLESMKDRTHDLETDLADSRDLMDSMRDPVLVLDAELRVVSANRAYCTTFELKLKQVEGKLLVELGGGQWDIPELKKMLNEVLEKDTSFDGFEVDREFDKIGRRIMLLNARRIDRWPGKPHRIVLVMEDATTSRMAKNAAEESEAFHRALLENVTDAVFLADDSGRIVYVGGNVQEIFKRSAEEIQELDNIDGLLGKDLFDPEELSQKGEIANIEREITDASGQKRILLISVKRVALRQGTVLYTCRDYTEGKEQEKRLSEALAQLGAVYAHAPMAIILVDRERRVTEVNRFAAHFAGRTAEEMIGLRSGEALRCLHHLDDPEGCGFGPVCKNCKVRLAVLDTFRDKKSRENIEAWSRFPAEGGSEERCLLVSIAYLEYEGNERVLVCVQDITSHKQAEESLRKSEEEYRLLFESANVGILIAQDGYIKKSNPYLSQLLGYLPAELDEQPFSRFIHPEDVSLVTTRHQERLSGKSDLPQTYDFRVISKNGTILWVQLSTVVIEWQGRPATLNFLHDITERKQAESKLKAEKEWSGKLVNNAPTIVVGLQERSRIALFNRFAEELTGYKAQEVIGKEWIEIFIPEELKETICQVWDNIVENKLVDHHSENEIITKSGERRLIEWRNTVITENGEFRMVLSHGVDITERKQAEEALRESEEKYRTLFETITEGIALHEVVYDEAGNAVNYRILDVNPAFERHTGIPVAAIRGKLATEAYGRDEPPYLSRYAEVVVTGKRTAFETYFPPMQRHFYIAAFSPAPGHFVTVFQDITERKRAEEEREKLQSQLLQAQRLESVGRLAGGVAHDFNNMLNVILGYAEIVLNQLRTGDPFRDFVEEIIKAGQRSALLTRQLLAFSRKQTLQPKVLDLNKVIRDMEKMLHRLIGEDIESELVLSEDIARVMADPGQIEQVIMNLAVNARDAMPKGGKLLLETANVELDEAYARTHAGVTPGKYVMLAVTDTGAGMDEETLMKIFEPFFSTKEKGKGTGLGLSTVYGIIKQSGGNIWAYSEPGRGTTFKIYLPQTEVGPEAKAGAAQKETTRGAGEQILVVEDEGSLRKLVGAMLSELGYKVSLAANGEEALLLMEKKGLKPDLVITDVVMPDMSGKELVDRLRETHPDLKVLYMSGYTDNAIVHHGVLDPGIHFVQKPFTLDDLAEKVQAALRGEGYGVSP